LQVLLLVDFQELLSYGYYFGVYFSGVFVFGEYFLAEMVLKLEEYFKGAVFKEVKAVVEEQVETRE